MALIWLYCALFIRAFLSPFLWPWNDFRGGRNFAKNSCHAVSLLPVLLSTSIPSTGSHPITGSWSSKLDVHRVLRDWARCFLQVSNIFFHFCWFLTSLSHWFQIFQGPFSGGVCQTIASPLGNFLTPYMEVWMIWFFFFSHTRTPLFISFSTLILPVRIQGADNEGGIYKCQQKTSFNQSW